MRRSRTTTRVGRRVRGADRARLGGRRRPGDQHHRRVVAGAPDAERELRVVLLPDQRVGARVGAELVAPDLPGPHRVVDPGVEGVAAVAGPGPAVVDVVDGVGDAGLAGQRADGDAVALAAGEVDADGDPGVVGAHVEHADREEVVALGLGVLVEDDLLAGQRGLGVDDRRRLARRGRGPAADGVAQPLAGAPVVPPRPAPDRHRGVGLDDPRADLLVDGLGQAGQAAERVGQVGVLGLEVRDDRGRVALAQPVIGVGADVPVGPELVGPGRRGGGLGHRPTLPGAGPREPVTTMAVGLIGRVRGRRESGLFALPAGLVRRPDPRVQAEEGPERGHRARDERYQGRGRLDARVPPQGPQALRWPSR